MRVAGGLCSVITCAPQGALGALAWAPEAVGPAVGCDRSAAPVAVELPVAVKLDAATGEYDEIEVAPVPYSHTTRSLPDPVGTEPVESVPPLPGVSPTWSIGSFGSTPV